MPAICIYLRVPDDLSQQYPEFIHLEHIADKHIAYSLTFFRDGNYEGEYWLVSFAIYALSAVANQYSENCIFLS